MSIMLMQRLLKIDGYLDKRLPSKILICTEYVFLDIFCFLTKNGIKYVFFFLPVELLCSKVLLKLAAATVDEVEGEGLTGDEQLMLA